MQFATSISTGAIRSLTRNPVTCVTSAVVGTELRRASTLLADRCVDTSPSRDVACRIVQGLAPAAIPVVIRALEKDAERFWRLSLEVGEAGIEFESDLPFEEGRLVEVEFTLPDDELLITLSGVVKTSDRVLFTSLHEDARLHLHRYFIERMSVP